MEFFYEEQMQKMEALGIERLPFEDCLCQVGSSSQFSGFSCIADKPIHRLHSVKVCVV